MNEDPSLRSVKKAEKTAATLLYEPDEETTIQNQDVDDEITDKRMLEFEL